MSVRHFTAASSEKITCSLGATNFVMGPGTVAAVFKTPATLVLGNLFSSGATGAVSWAMAIDTAGKPRLATNNTNVTAGATALAVSKWYLVAMSKATGTVTPRIHIYDYAAVTWVHENAGGTLADSSTPITRCAIGVGASGAAGFWDGDIAAVAIWNVVLTDTQAEALLLFLPAVSKGLWRLNQDVTTENVLDMSGGGANQSAIVGTSITAVVQDVGMFNVAPPKPFEPRVGSYGLQAANRAATW